LKYKLLFDGGDAPDSVVLDTVNMEITINTTDESLIGSHTLSIIGYSPAYTEGQTDFIVEFLEDPFKNAFAPEFSAELEP